MTPGDVVAWQHRGAWAYGTVVQVDDDGRADLRVIAGSPSHHARRPLDQLVEVLPARRFLYGLELALQEALEVTPPEPGQRPPGRGPAEVGA